MKWYKNKKGFIRKDEAFFSPRVPGMRTLFPAKVLLRAINRGPKGIEYQIQYENWPKSTQNGVMRTFTKRVILLTESLRKRSKRREEQREIFQDLLAFGEVDSQADIDRKFDCSRAWVSKVLK
ncbi:hypothetical protein CK503_01800 [Aliifodinibius salipaludis]|uniref:Uncharacterized protein n=1 Tax=Fodinibius salipaludis TaxID=2032627 RepID=A0A2A2GFW1_9BACT|nr:hypothetical protein CK503_01800 [Aliifodinibius salipaludis]